METKQFITDFNGQSCPVERRQIELREAEQRRELQATEDRRRAEAVRRDFEAVIEQHIEHHITHLVEAIKKVEADWSRTEFDPLKAEVASLQRRAIGFQANLDAKAEVAERIAEHHAERMVSPLQRTIEGLQQRVEELEARDEFGPPKAEVASLQRRIGDFKASLDSKIHDLILCTSTSRRTTLDRMVDPLRATIATLQRRIDKIEAHHEVEQASRGRIDELEARLETKREAAELQQRIAEIHAERLADPLQRTIETLQQRVVELEAHHEVDSLKTEVADLQRRITGLQAGVDARDETAELRRKIAENHAGRLVEPLQRTVEALQQRVADLESHREVEPLRRENQALRGRIDELEARLTNVAALAPAKLPIAKAFVSGVVNYMGDVVVHNGSTFMATKDTAREPPHDDWACLARRGTDARSPHVRGAWNANATYKSLDIVHFAGASWIARNDRPSGPPFNSADWAPLASKGERGAQGLVGARGPRGQRGERGSDTDFTTGFHVDAAHYRVYVLNNDGTLGKMIDLMPLFERFLIEAQPFDEPRG